MQEDDEVAELRESLVRAAAAGQDLVVENDRLAGENERLRKMLEQQQQSQRKKQRSPSPFMRAVDSEAFPTTRLRTSTVDERSRAPSGASAVWEAELEKTELEEKHRDLQNAYAHLERELEAERQAQSQARRGSQQDVRWHEDSLPERKSRSHEPETEREEANASARSAPKAALQDCQQQVEDLAQSCDFHRAEAEMLRGQLQEQMGMLEKAREEAMDLHHELRICGKSLSAAQQELQEQRQSSEIENINRGTQAMRRNLTDMRRLSTALVEAQQQPRSVAAEGGRDVCLFDDLHVDAEGLHEENRDLLEEIQALRRQLRQGQAQTPEAEPLAPIASNGDAAAGWKTGGVQGISSCSTSDTAQALRTLQQALDDAQVEVVATNQKLMRHRNPQLGVQQEEESFFQRHFGSVTELISMCCRSEGRPAGQS